MDSDKSESQIKTEIRKHLSKLGVVLWQQATGHGRTESGSEVSFGLCRGSSDLIGIRVRDGKFTVVEVKTIGGMIRHNAALQRALIKNAQRTPITLEERRAFEQAMFVRLVIDSNGLAGFATSADEAERIVSK